MHKIMLEMLQLSMSMIMNKEDGMDLLFDVMIEMLEKKAQEAYERDDCDSEKEWTRMKQEVERCAGRVCGVRLGE